MQTITSRKIRQVLRSQLNLRPVATGKNTGHEIWEDVRGRTCKPVLRHKEIPYAILYSLGLEMENKGICTRRAFLQMITA